MFIAGNIQSAWETIGIYLYNPQLMIATVMQQSTIAKPQQVRILTSAYSLSQCLISYKKIAVLP